MIELTDQDWEVLNTIEQSDVPGGYLAGIRAGMEQAVQTCNDNQMEADNENRRVFNFACRSCAAAIQLQMEDGE